jgi:hypothetical protein
LDSLTGALHAERQTQLSNTSCNGSDESLDELFFAMARKLGGLRPSVYQGADHWSILYCNGQWCDLSVIPRHAAFEPRLFVSLSDKRTFEDRRHAIDLFSQKLQSALAQDPKKYSCRWLIHLMLISKKQE